MQIGQNQREEEHHNHSQVRGYTHYSKLIMSPLYRKSFFTFLLVIALCLVLASSSEASKTSTLSDKEPTAYEILGDYNFPIGLLPKGVLGYHLDNTTGGFSAFLTGTCRFSIEGSYQLRYKPTINGYISRGKLSSLEGVSVRLFFMWVDIVEVLRSGDHLQFSVGIAGAGFPIDNFEECPRCGCGFNCGDNGVKSIVTLQSPARQGKQMRA